MTLCLENGISYIKWNGVEIGFHPRLGEAALPENLNAKPEKPNFPDPDLKMPSDEEMLNWSTPLSILEEPKSN
jgi:hypothetical protein